MPRHPLVIISLLTACGSGSSGQGSPGQGSSSRESSSRESQTQPQDTAAVTPEPTPTAAQPASAPPEPTVHTTAVEAIRSVSESRSYEDISEAIGEGIDTPSQGRISEVVEVTGEAPRFFVLAFVQTHLRPNVGEAVGDLWLHLVRGQPNPHPDFDPPPDVQPNYRRVQGVCIAENVSQSDGQGIEVPERMTLSDLDHDRETEVTIITRYIPMARGQEYERGLAAFIVGADFNIQARFSRIYHHDEQDAAGDTQYQGETTWLLRDTNSDGHADIRVRERYSLNDSWGGDTIDSDEGEPLVVEGRDNHGRYDRNQVCAYDQASDAWQCPNPPMGQILFTPPSSRASFR